MIELLIDHADGAESTLSVVEPDNVGDEDLPSLNALTIDRELVREPDEPDEAEATVYRDAWLDVVDDVDGTNDELRIEEDGEPIFGGRLKDWEFDGVLVSVLLEGPKRDAIDAEPSGGNDVFEPKPDSDIVADILERVPTIDAGDIETVNDALGFSESQASPGKSLEKLARDTGGELRYNADFTLDYLEELGDERDTVLSPGNANVISDPRIQTKVREEVTHVRVLGSQEGTAQVRAEAVADSYDPETDRAVWRKKTDKEIQQESRAESLAEQLIDEYDGEPEYVEVEMELTPDVEPSIGDRFDVELPAFGIDKQLRIMGLERLIDDAGDRFRALLSNRKLSREQDGEAKTRSINEFREGNAGQYFFNSDGRGPEPIKDGEPFAVDIPYPDDVIADIDASLTIKSQAYRGRVESGGHSHEVSIGTHTHTVSVDTTSDANSDFENIEDGGSQLTSSITIDDWTEIASFEPSNSGSETRALTRVTITDYDTGELEIRLRNKSAGESFGQLWYGSVEEGQNLVHFSSDNSDTSGDELAVEARVVTIGTGGSTSEMGITAATVFEVVGTHNHEIEDSTTSSAGGATTETTDEAEDLVPGINTFDDETVSGVTVELNGETVLEDVDDGDLPETLDITGDLEAGDNEVVFESETLGEIEVEWAFEGLKNAGADD